MKALLSRLVAGARGYRFDGEEQNHADQLRETQAALSMMAAAAPDDPDQARMASEIEDGAENRLVVLLGKPRLTLHEKRERDAIQAGIAERRQSFDAPAERPSRIRALFAPLATANPLAGILMSPALWVAAAFAIPAAGAAVQTMRLHHAKHDLTEARADLAQTERTLAARTTERNLLARRAAAADAQSQRTADNIEAERARRLRTERELRRVRDAMDQAGSSGPIDYGFGGVRDAGPSPGPGDGASAPAGDPR